MLLEQVKRPKRVNPAVLVIDMQKDFLHNIRDRDVADLISSQEALMSYCGLLNIPAILVEYESYGRTVKPVFEAWQHAEIQERLTKYDDDAFVCTELQDILNELCVNYLFLTGINATGCVKMTGMSALRRGYAIGTAHESIADPVINDHWYSQYANWYQERGDLFETVEDAMKILVKK